MTSGEMSYLILVIAAIGGFGFWLAYNTVRYDRSRAGKPEALRYEAPKAAASVGTD